MKVDLRNGVAIEDPVAVVRGYIEEGWVDTGDPSRPAGSFDEADMRRANRGGARIAATEIVAILERRRRIERALRAIDPTVSLAGAAARVPWPAVSELFDAFGDIHGVGFSKMTKALHPKRPALIPMLDSVVQRYLVDDHVGAEAAFGERAVALVRSYRRDLLRNRKSLRAVQRELARRGQPLTEVRILDLLIWSVEAR